MLRGYCDDKKWDLLTIEEDDLSAAGADGHLHRSGLQRAMQIAKKENAAILVPSVDRLARHPGVLSDIFNNNLPVISVAEGRRVGRKSLERLISKAQRDHKEIASRVRSGMARAKAHGLKLGNPTNLDVAQRKGAISNIFRADRKIQELTDFLEHTPGWEKMVLRELVEIVNRSGPHNLVSENREERKLWTLGSIRKPLKKAQTEFQNRIDMAAEDISTAPNWSWDSSLDEREVVAVDEGDGPSSGEDHLPASVAYKDHPGFGKFRSGERNGSTSREALMAVSVGEAKS